jgi:restriction endonuclease Mrr
LSIYRAAYVNIGYAVRLTRPAKDGGKDIVVEFVASKEKQSYYIEIKHWVSGPKVGKHTVREFLSVVVRDQRQGGVIISTSGFTASAMQGITEIERKKTTFWKQQYRGCTLSNVLKCILRLDSSC